MKKPTLLFLAVLLFTFLKTSAQVYQDSAFNALIRKYNGGWIAGDATFSIQLPDSRTLWLFGDSFTGTVNADSSIAPGAHFIRNCAVVQDGDSMQALFGGTFSNPSAFLNSPKPDSVWYWPEHGLVENDTLKIFFSEFVTAPGAPGFNFKYSGAYIAFFSFPDIGYLDKIRLPYYDINKVSYGNSVMTDNGYTYIYGRKEADTVYHIPYPHVARVPSGNLQAPWQFFDGTSWTNDPALTKKIGNVAVSQQYGFFKQEGIYVLITQDIWLSPKIYSYTSAKPYGPLSNKVLLYQTPILYPNTFTYNAFPHIQFTDAGEMLVSYNTNGDFWQIFSNVEIYRPRFIRVPLSLINPAFTSAVINKREYEEEGAIKLFQNIPNPVTSITEVSFKIEELRFISLELKDLYGRRLHTWFNRELQPGTYSVTMDLSNLNSGIYYYGVYNTFRKLIKN